MLPAGTGPGRAGGRRGGEGLLSSGVLAQFHTSDTKVNRPRRHSRGHRHPRVQAAAAHPPDEARLRGCELRGWTLNTRVTVGGGAAAAGAGHCCSTESAPLAHLHSRQSVSSLASRHYHARHHDPPSRALMISADIVSLDLAAANKATAITAMNINVSPNPLGTVYATKRRRRSNKR